MKNQFFFVNHMRVTAYNLDSTFDLWMKQNQFHPELEI